VAPISRLLGLLEPFDPFVGVDGVQYPHPSKPFISVGIYRRNGVELGNTDFLIDTGADLTFISPLQRRELAFTESELVSGPPERMRGLGGGLPTGYLLNVNLEFLTVDGGTCWIPLDRLGVLRYPEDELERYATIPSVLGMDILSQCSIEFTKTEAILNYRPR